MIKTLAGQVKEFKKDSILTPFFMILEVIMEMIIPLLMSSIIDDGVERGDIHHIYIIGIWMVAAAGIGLFAGVMGHVHTYAEASDKNSVSLLHPLSYG